MVDHVGLPHVLDLACDYGVSSVPIGLGFGTALGLGLRGPDLGLGLDN